jgi:hypothetical protein
LPLPWNTAIGVDVTDSMEAIPSKSSTPVLLIVHHRPDKTQRVLEALRASPPSELYVAGDGPRPGVPSDVDNCRRTQDLFQDLDFPCKVHILFRDENLGVMQHVEAALAWFFQNAEEGVILEDDCLPTSSFLPFCAEMLERYRQDPRVMMVAGHNTLGRWTGAEADYSFARSSATWGWATWRSSWDLYDSYIVQWNDPEVRQRIRTIVPGAHYRTFEQRFDDVNKRRYTWDFAWQFCLLINDGLCVMPSVNMITNIGFDEEAVYTKIPWPHEMNVATGDLTFPLTHPTSAHVDEGYEDALFRHRFPLTRRTITRLPPRLHEPARRLLYLWAHASRARPLRRRLESSRHAGQDRARGSPSR